MHGCCHTGPSLPKADRSLPSTLMVHSASVRHSGTQETRSRASCLPGRWWNGSAHPSWHRHVSGVMALQPHAEGLEHACVCLSWVGPPRKASTNCDRALYGCWHLWTQRRGGIHVRACFVRFASASKVRRGRSNAVGQDVMPGAVPWGSGRNAANAASKRSSSACTTSPTPGSRSRRGWHHPRRRS